MQPIIDIFSSAIFIVDARALLKMANRSAMKMLDEGRYLSLAEGSLTFRSTLGGGRLARAITQVCSRQIDCHAVLLDGIRGTPAMQVVVSPVQTDVQHHRGDNWAILMADFLKPAQSDLRPLQMMFGLTPREIETVEDLVSGLTAEESAQRRGVALSTVRSHLRSLFAKTGAETQAQLMLTLRSLPSLGHPPQTYEAG